MHGECTWINKIRRVPKYDDVGWFKNEFDSIFFSITSIYDEVKQKKLKLWIREVSRGVFKLFPSYRYIML